MEFLATDFISLQNILRGSAHIGKYFLTFADFLSKNWRFVKSAVLITQIGQVFETEYAKNTKDFIFAINQIGKKRSKTAREMKSTAIDVDLAKSPQ